MRPQARRPHRKLPRFGRLPAVLAERPFRAMGKGLEEFRLNAAPLLRREREALLAPVERAAEEVSDLREPLISAVDALKRAEDGPQT